MIFPPMSRDLPWLVFPSRRRRRSWIGRCVDESEGARGRGERAGRGGEREKRERGRVRGRGEKRRGERERGEMYVLDCKSQHDNFLSYFILLL